MEDILRPDQYDAVHQMKNGCILCGGVGSGKSRTALMYYLKSYGGWLSIRTGYLPPKNPEKLFVITTAKKRDSHEWETEMIPFHIDNYVVDSWNNIAKYKEEKGCFFIFDEQRVVGDPNKGAWVKAFLRIAKYNKWILLSATPGDKWDDYIPVFIANGFYKNKAEFESRHYVYNRWMPYPKVERVLDEWLLDKLKYSILVDIRYERHTEEHHEDVFCSFDFNLYRNTMKTRQWEGEPIETGTKLCYILRKILNSDEDRQVKLLELMEKHPRVIVFYNFDYERDILLSLQYGEGVAVAEWSGKKHEPIPDSEKWIYVAQYTANAEGWNCILTDTIIFFSQNYSYRTLVQACGRINRANTPFKDLYYYHFKCKFGIDLAISNALRNKKEFNERKYYEKLGG